MVLARATQTADTAVEVRRTLRVKPPCTPPPQPCTPHHRCNRAACSCRAADLTAAAAPPWGGRSWRTRLRRGS
eukprot:134515-Prymnesium_polylepis.1